MSSFLKYKNSNAVKNTSILSTYNVSDYETLLIAIAQPTFAISKKMGETQFDTYSTLRFGWLCTQQYNK